jgi:hypothetical protein
MQQQIIDQMRAELKTLPEVDCAASTLVSAVVGAALIYP